MLFVGSGKTTLMRTLAGITDGSAIIDGVVKLDGKVANENIFAKLATFSQQTVRGWSIQTGLANSCTHIALGEFEQRGAIQTPSSAPVL
jgi:ABC-type cobalamin/Fe3+-siderophores transport system ATPase subunit